MNYKRKISKHKTRGTHMDIWYNKFITAKLSKLKTYKRMNTELHKMLKNIEEN